MLSAVRKNHIKNILYAQKNVTVMDLADKFTVTQETIRRNLKELEQEGILNRTHGGAVLREVVPSYFTSNETHHVKVESKQYMAQLVRPLFKNGQCIYLDSSTTVLYTIEAMANLNLTVVSNSLEAISVLSKYSNIKIVSLGGTLSQQRRCFIGSTTCNMLKNYYFDMVLFSSRTVSLTEGACDSDDDEAQIKKTALMRTKASVLMADYSKIDKISFAKICDLKKVSYFITDQPLTQNWSKYMNDNNIQYMM